jgi:hypothetical protein
MMKSYRGNAIAAGTLLILCSAAAILSIVPLGARVEAPVDFAELAGRDDAVVMTALIELVWAATGMGIAIALYPVLRLSNTALALGSVVGRLVENVFILLGTLSLLALLTLSQQATDAAAPSLFQATGDALVAVREWAPEFVAGIAFVVGTFMYNYVMYGSRLVPRWLSGWGLVGAVLSLVPCIYAGFTQDFGFTTMNNVLSAPIGLQEMVLAVWLIVRGFDLSALRSTASSTVRSTMPAGLGR